MYYKRKFLVVWLQNITTYKGTNKLQISQQKVTIIDVIIKLCPLQDIRKLVLELQTSVYRSNGFLPEVLTNTLYLVITVLCIERKLKYYVFCQRY